MPDAWTDKQERQYRHIRDGYVKSGASPEEAEERAARTINARREAAGEAKGGDGAPSKDDLYQQARRFDIAGRSKMDKRELEDAIAGHRGGAGEPRSDT
ncbi:MAG: plasmid stabilization protein [Thermoleophilia bacterium]|nr:plasmid stabilization protein [Thermoleophilia bacterium]